MFFEIENIGKIRNAQIEMRGITVLAGNNSTGKSTFGKALFCIFNAFSESDKAIMRTRKSDIENMLTRYARRTFVRSSKISKLAEAILDTMDSPQEIQKTIQDAIELRIIIPPEADDSVDMLFKIISDYANVNDEQIQKEILGKYFAAEFEGQLTHVNMPQRRGKIALSFKKRQFNLEVCVDKNRYIEYTSNVGIIHRAFYLDTPFVVDIISPYASRSDYIRYNHRYEISRCLYRPDNGDNISEEVISKQKLVSILDHINSTVPGDFDKTESGNMGFRVPGLMQPLELTNVSAGMKLFLVVKRLLEKGKIKARDVLILDEPEIHLHPEWQVKFAEMLVLLQKAFDLTILLTTHSPYFLRAIEVFSVQQDIADHCNFYHLTNDEEGYCHVQDVTDDTGGIYQTLAKPFQILDNIHYASYDP
jgi:predicted ATPase